MKKLLLFILFITLAGWGFGQTTYNENFDEAGNWAGGSMTGYNAKTYTNDANNPANDKFSTDNAVRESSNVNSGSYAWRLHKSSAYLRYECSETVSAFSVYMARWDNSPKPNVTIRYSTNSGNTYTTIETIDGDYFTGDKVYKKYSHTFSTAISPDAAGDKIYIEFVTTSGERMLYDDFELTYGSGNSAPDNPSGFNANPISTSEIDLSWTKNGNNDNVMIAYNTSNTFGTPADGTPYYAGDNIPGGGEVLYNGDATSFQHIALSSGTHYYYKAWSVDGSVNYSSGVTDDASTYKEEPSNDVSGFSHGTPAATSIPLNWNDNDGAVAADGYLIMINTTDNFTDPVDGTPQSDDLDVSDGTGQVNVSHGDQSYTWQNLNQNTHYYFIIYPYTNSGTHINYKTSGTTPKTDATTATANTNLIISEVADPKDVSNAKFVEIYNLSSSPIDLGAGNWYLVIEQNNSSGGIGAYKNIALTGSINGGGTYVVANNATDYNNSYGLDADQYSGNISGNGNDGYFLYYNGDHSTGTLIDAYGVQDENGTGKVWEYKDSHAIRFPDVTLPSATYNADDWVTVPANVVDMTPSVYKENFTWNGGTSSDWNNKANWKIGSGAAAPTIPDISCSVTIPSGTTHGCDVGGTPDFPNQALSITVDNGAAFTVPVGKAIDLGDLTNHGTVTVASDANGNGSLIVHRHFTGDNVTVQRYIAGYTSDDNGWHEIGCPVSSMTIAGSDFVPSSGTYDLYVWNQSAADGKNWVNYKQSDGSEGFTTFTAGQGYLVAYSSNKTLSFTGALTTNDVTMDNLSSGGTGSGWHLLGNPYPCALNWNDGSWTLSHVGGVAQIWDEASGSYAQISANGTIPATNGFFVEVDAGQTGKVVIPEGSRTQDATNNYKRAEANKPKETLKFTITDDANSYKDESTIGFRSDATEKWDIAFDAHKLMSLVNAAPQIWTVSNGENFVINYLPEITKPYDVPLDFHAGVNTLYHLSVQGINSFNNPHFVLEDTRTGDMINLSQQSRYDFSAAKGDDIHRFVLHINGVTAVPQQKNNSGIHIFAYRKTVVIEGNKNLNGNVSVFDLMGRKVFTAPLNETNKQTFRLAQQTGIYFIKVEGTQGVTTKKVFIQ